MFCALPGAGDTWRRGPRLRQRRRGLLGDRAFEQPTPTPTAACTKLATTEMVGLCVLIPLRYLVRRERPTAKKPGPIPIPWERYSFPSSHALRSAGVAVVMGIHFSGIGWALLPAALLVGWSRVPLGRHYPSDVAAGWVLGIACGGIGVWLAGTLF